MISKLILFGIKMNSLQNHTIVFSSQGHIHSDVLLFYHVGTPRRFPSGLTATITCTHTSIHPQQCYCCSGLSYAENFRWSLTSNSQFCNVLNAKPF